MEKLAFDGRDERILNWAVIDWQWLPEPNWIRIGQFWKLTIPEDQPL